MLREACAAHGGREVNVTGDGSLMVFARASDAVAAAAVMQRGLHEQLWAGESVRMRIGLHTGQPQPTAEGYVGIDVHHGARVMAAAHGGQVLLSQSTRNAVDDFLDETQLRNLGRHRLKDIESTEPIYQLLIEGLPNTFPPLRAIDLRPHNLPASATTLIGRSREMADAIARLQRAEVRLLTLTGTGGTGKTRLSLQVAEALLSEFEDGVFFVGLATVRDADFVVPTIAQTLKVPEAAGQSLLQALQEHLKNRQMLLLLDNFEQIVEAAPVVAELLTACRGIKILATSRVSLHLHGEHEFGVPPLALPEAASPSLEALSRSEAVQLFVERAQAQQATFALNEDNAAAVAAICTHLDGLPLAIELAAPRLRILSVSALLVRLEHRFKVLNQGARDLPLAPSNVAQLHRVEL